MKINIDKIKEWLKYFEEADEVTNISCTVIDNLDTCYFICVFPALENMTIELKHNAIREVDLDKPTTVHLYAAKPHYMLKDITPDGYKAYYEENTISGCDDFLLAIFKTFVAKALKAARGNKKLPFEDRQKLTNALTYFKSKLEQDTVKSTQGGYHWPPFF